MEQSRVTSEFIPSGQGMPDWLFEALCSPTPLNVLVLHPSELHRQQTLERLHERGAAASPNLHLTLNRLVRLLHTDLRLPVLLDDDASNFMAVHARCVQAAEDGRFPFLHVPGVGAWSMTKTKRLAQLHGELIHLRRPFDWENDPGASVYHELLETHQHQAGGTLPSLVFRSVVESLARSDEVPFHLSNVDGLVLLDMAPDFSELEQDLLLHIAVHRPLHQLLCPGSFRLGHHGAYVVDEPPCSTKTLPDWLPSHDVWTPTEVGWRSPVGENKNTAITRLTVDERTTIPFATQALIDAFLRHEEGSVLVIDASVRERERMWKKALKQVGLTWGGTASRLEQQPIHHAVLAAARLSQGMSAWSLSSLQTVATSVTLPLKEDLFPDLAHPLNADWRPRPHLSVLEDIARNFHVLGGPGALSRWLGVLANAQPSFAERQPEQQRQRLEETQWWLACLLRTWSPLLSGEERHLLSASFVGCSSGAEFPLPPEVKDGAGWLSWLVQAIDLGRLSKRRAPADGGLGALQRLLDAMNTVLLQLKKLDLHVPLIGRDFVEMLEHLGSSTGVPHLSAHSNRVHVVSPEDALGCEADVVVLAGVDVDAWPMRSPVVPWMDAHAQVQLGVFHPDRVIRKARHHLRHLLNAASNVIVMDSTPEEGGGPCAPLAEWLNDVQRSNEWGRMRAPPSFLPSSDYQGDGDQRRFHWVAREPGHGAWLTPLTTVLMDEDGVLNPRHRGFGLADRRQQLGLDVHARRPFEDELNNPLAALDRYESGIQGDRYRRQPSHRDLDEGQTLGWEQRERLVSADAVVLRPTKAALGAPGVVAAAWPHLGHRATGPVSLTVDPRPLPPYALDDLALSHRFGGHGAAYERRSWSPSRLEAWLKCPRQAWVNQVLLADDGEEGEAEDIDVRVRGQILHDTEAALLVGHGVPLGGELTEAIQPLHLGPMGVEGRAWETVLAFLQRDVPWLGRKNAVSIHRTRDLVDATPDEWQSAVEGELELPARGRLSRLVEADLALHHAAPVAVEWSPRRGDERSVRLGVHGGPAAGFPFFGYADRVDVLALTAEQAARLTESGVLGPEAFETPYPLDGTPRTAQRLVVIRDLKSVTGPSPKYAGLRHTRCLFEDLQLALYARAWELLHPNDRVVGVGASEIGENTVHYVELDSALEALDETLLIGDITRYFPAHFPSTTSEGAPTTPFRRWMVERLLVAQRAVDAAASGHINPTPGAHCDYCSVANACGAAQGAGAGA